MIQEVVLPGNTRITRDSVCKWKFLQDGKVIHVFGRYISRQDYDIILKAQDMGVIDYAKVFTENKIPEYFGKDGAFIYLNKGKDRINEIKNIQEVIGDEPPEEENSPEGELAELVRQLEQIGEKQ